VEQWCGARAFELTMHEPTILHADGKDFAVCGFSLRRIAPHSQALLSATDR
jgi:hypothetical protein